jgi:hypothetical protein
MPSRKQRRRRQKERRHEWEYVYVDDEGHEVEVEPEPKEERGKPAKAVAKQAAKKPGARPLREPPVPTWNRSFKRALPWQGLLLLAVLFLLKSGPLVSRLSVAVLYGVTLVPFMYWMDKLARQRWLRTTGQLPPKEKTRPKKR